MLVASTQIGIGQAFPTGGWFQPLTDCLGGLGCGQLLWEEGSPAAFLLMTVLLGGGCAYMAGRALALSWRPLLRLLVYMALFGFAIRFLHWGLFSGTLLWPWYYLVDAAVLMLIAAIGFQYTRTNQLATKYHWLYRRTTPFTVVKRS